LNNPPPVLKAPAEQRRSTTSRCSTLPARAPPRSLSHFQWRAWMAAPFQCLQCKLA